MGLMSWSSAAWSRCSRRNGRSRTPRIPLVQIVYSPVYGDWQHAAEVFRGSGAFEQIAQELRSSYTLKKTVTLRARACGGDPNAYYDSDEIEVIFCYELMDDLLNLIASDLPEDTVSSDHVGRTGPASTD